MRLALPSSSPHLAASPINLFLTAYLMSPLLILLHVRQTNLGPITGPYLEFHPCLDSSPFLFYVLYSVINLPCMLNEPLVHTTSSQGTRSKVLEAHWKDGIQKPGHSLSRWSTDSSAVVNGALEAPAMGTG